MGYHCIRSPRLIEEQFMKKLMSFFLLAPALAGLAAFTVAQAGDETLQLDLDGLQLVKKDRNGEIYANPDVDWSVYTAIVLEDATVAFRRNWKRDQNQYQPFKVQDSDVERIKRQLGELFHEVFAEELTKDDGYTLTDTHGSNVLVIQPAIVNLDIYAPDTNRPYPSRQYTDQAGEMTLKLAIFDSVTGDLLATARDRRRSPYRGYYQWTNSVTNLSDARQILIRWADTLRERLDQARVTGTPALVADGN